MSIVITEKLLVAFFMLFDQIIEFFGEERQRRLRELRDATKEETRRALREQREERKELLKEIEGLVANDGE